MMIRFFSVFATIIILSGCGGAANEQECTSDECLKQQAYDKVIAIHDEVMPKLSYISELKGKLEEQTNAMNDSLAIASWQQLMVNLDVADEAMWIWMREFNSNLEDVALPEALEYLKLEQVKIDEVALKINEAVANAEEALAK